MKETEQIYGLRAIIEAVNAKKEVDKVFLQKGLRGELMQELERALRINGITTAYVPIEKLNRLTKSNHQGAVATISPITFLSIEELVDNVATKETPSLFLLLDQLSDVRNFGAVIRTAECTGVDGIIIQKKGAAPVTADTIKTSAGAAFKVPIAKVDHLTDAVYYLQASGVKIISASEKATSLVYDLSFEGNVAIVMGAEDKGVSPSILKASDKTARIPLKGEIASLNVSVACAVFLYEAVRQRALLSN